MLLSGLDHNSPIPLDKALSNESGETDMRMSLICCTVLLAFTAFVATACWADYEGVMSELLINRDPSARWSTLGKAAVLPDGGPFAGYYNPAGLVWVDGASLSWSRSTKFYLLDDVAFTFIGAAGDLGDLGIVSLSRYELSYRWASIEPEQTSSSMCLAYCRRFGRGLAAAASLNRFEVTSEREDGVAYTSDIGVLKSTDLPGGGRLAHRVIVASALLNWTGTSIEVDQIDNDLPIILRLGAAYSMMLSVGRLLPDLTTMEASIQAEYYDLLNSDFNRRFSLGSEIRLFEILALRLGYYDETRSDYGYETNKDSIAEVTSGLGLNLPLMKLSDGRIPLNAALDIARLHQPKVTTSSRDWPDYTHYSASVSWVR
jgi:hypothetical protein